MKKLIALLLACIMCVSVFVGCDDGNAPAGGTTAGTTAATDKADDERAAKYAAAVAALEDDVLDADGMYTMSEDLIVALENAEFTEAKNIIFMIGDGMGFNQIEGAEATYADKLYNGKMAWRYLPMASSQSSSSASDTVTDSAAGGTALSAGYRTTNGVLAMDTEAGESYKTVLELAAEKGKSTGVIATKNVTDATPASYTAHVGSRSEELEIAVQQAGLMLDGSLDVLLGGGSKYFNESRNKNVQKMQDAGVTYTNDFSEAVAAEMPIAGIFSDDSIDTTDPDMPTVAEMTELALRELSKDENGFFLMVEGSQIDTCGHDGDVEGQMREMYHFDCAIAVALRFVAMNPDTVIIVTADHETGGLILPDKITKDNASEMYFTSDGAHTQTNVPVLAIGHGVEALDGINHNTDCAIFVASLLGEESFGQEKKVHTFLDTDLAENVTAVVDANSAMASAGEGSIAVTFDADNASLSIPVDALDTPMADVEKGIRTVVMTIKNTGDTSIAPPVITMKTPRVEVSVDEKYTWIEAGETKMITYVFGADSWNPSRLLNLKEFYIGYAEGESATIEISDIYVTERPMDK